MSTAYALGKRSIGQFILERNYRLAIPLIFGMLVIVPPQVYVERIAYGGYDGSYLDFLMGPAFQGIYPEGNVSWHHLWFLPYLLIFSMVLAPVFNYLRKHPESRSLTGLRSLIKVNPYHLLWLVVPLYLYESLLEPFFEVTHNLVGDWFNFISSLTLFFYGFIMINLKQEFWAAIDKIKSTTLIIGVICYLSQLFIWFNLEDGVLVHFTEAFLKSSNIWAWIITIFGYGALLLNKPSAVLSYANRAVYPFYILHQTITVILGYFIYQQPWGLFPKASIMVIGTFGIAFIIYEFCIRRIRLLHPLFGLK
jgi:hypothetical protein